MADGTSNFVELDWNQSPEGDLAGYRIYGSQNENALSLRADVPVASLADPTQPSWIVWNLPSYGRWFYQITAYDTSNNEGLASEMVSKVIGGDDQCL
jgi:hypothetical protein